MSDKQRQAAELEDIGDINSEVDDAWAEAVRQIRTKREKGSSTSGHYGHEGRPGKVGGSAPSGPRRVVSSKKPEAKLTAGTNPRDHPDDIIPGRQVSWNVANERAKIVLRRAKSGYLEEPTPHQLDIVTDWLTYHDEKVIDKVRNIYWPQTQKDFLIEAERSGVRDPLKAAAYCEEDYDLICMGTKKAGYFHHEMGHIAWNNARTSARVKWILEWRLNKDFDRFTNYSKKDNQEGFAETYEAYIQVGGRVGTSDPKRVRLESAFDIVKEVIDNVY